MDFKKISISVAIAILLTLFLVYSVELIHEEPKFLDYCESGLDYARPIPTNEKLCPEFIYDFNTCYNGKGYVEYEYDNNGCIINATCSNCSLIYEDAREKYSTISFIVFSILGAIVILLGIYLFLDPVSHGFLLGGILTILQSTIKSFTDFGEITRIIVLGLELGVLIWVSYKKFSKETNKKK